MSARLDIAAQAKAWNRKRIASGDVVLLYCELWAMPALGTAEEDDDWDAVDRAGSLRAEDGFIIVRMAANHYPHPLNSALLDAALPLLQQQVNRWCLGGIVTEGLPFDVVEGVIKKSWRNPMRFLVEAAALKRAMALIHPVVPRRGINPVHESVLLKLVGDRLSIHADDSPHAVIFTFDVKGAEDGEAVVSGARLKAIADAAPDGAEIALSCADVGEGAVVTSGRSRFRLAVLPPSQFPPFHFVAGTNFNLQAGELERLLTVSACVSREETRYYLCGVFLHRRGETLSCAATDGARLALVSLPLPDNARALEDNSDQGAGAIIPTEAARHIHAIVGERKCQLTLGDAAIQLECEIGDGSSVTYRSRLIDGTFPAYGRVIPERKSFDGMAQIDTARFRAALKRVSVALSAVEGGDKKPKEYIRLTFDEGVLRLDAAGDLGESASEELDIEWSGTAALTCGFNWRYLDAVAALADSDEMRFWPDATGPGRVEPKHDDDRVYVVMPARV